MGGQDYVRGQEESSRQKRVPRLVKPQINTELWNNCYHCEPFLEMCSLMESESDKVERSLMNSPVFIVEKVENLNSYVCNL